MVTTVHGVMMCEKVKGGSDNQHSLSAMHDVGNIHTIYIIDTTRGARLRLL